MEKQIGNIIYEVVIDEDEFNNCFTSKDYRMDFESEKDMQRYKQRFIKGEICGFIVIAKKLCPCCENYTVIDSLFGIHAENEEEALKVYLS